MAESKSKSQERREEASASAEVNERDGKSTYFYPDLGRSVRAASREEADELIEADINKEAGGDAEAGEDKAE